MAITLGEFRKKYLGKTVTGWVSSNTTPGQCTELVHQYMVECFGWTRAQALDAIPNVNANEFFHQANPAYFTKIVNTPSGIPQHGDIVVLNHGPYGHVFIIKDGCTTHIMYSLDQNWSNPHHVTDEAHGYAECIGWLRRR